MPSPASIPARFLELDFDDYQPGTPSAVKALAAAQRFGSERLSGLVLAGPTGVGKTHLALCAARAHHAAALESHDAKHQAWASTARSYDACPTHPRGPQWQNVAELIVGLREDMDKPAEDKRWAYRVEELRTHPGVVVLDDLGREKSSDWTGETIYALVNRRYESMVPTVVTTNLLGSELAASPYWPVISRLAEDGELVRIEAKDWRLAK